ncbi:iron-siderophore ABC transporter substrate-binding protein [Deinococcus soli (ex Cha et al. 2016)]|uniref:Iron complex transport system substrate-binding protein n=2 Tax=Deinococcus soli (ex Cha et al. 2016) TaxID=1309411 RepID=A0ACC6KLP0_9DEIO|nr:iron-siderophore ABC transporter substrate-binding protein [Deinococcus soli (ex Cha et al. 2016)]MDR6220174.1 iron complex transport system substrate-binding protein [Deinococcus soli (ex Cha et al. 2016)]MDR6330029.1 iron complex transport system substrate-binding protein [Deinococcus soli (ex Cha et al. 2016)]MDR6753340.1 iron complex transport system substrate-binding protein [Deinococcus soli (ex Cha et al. 2016)]
MRPVTLRRPTILLATTLLTGLLATAGAAPITLRHAAGTTTLPAPATRVVALGPHALDLLLSLGIQPVGYGEAAQLNLRQYGSPIRQIRYLGSRVTGAPTYVGDRFKPNLEVLASLKPDLIVGEHFAQDTYPALNAIAPTLLFRGTHSGDWQKTLPVLARAVNRPERAAQVIRQRAAATDRARQTLPAWLRGRRALVIWNAGGATRDLYTVLGPDDWTGGYFQNLGLTLDLPGRQDPSLGEGYLKLSSEGLSATRADAIFVIASGKNTAAQARRDWHANPFAQRLPASRAGHVYFLDIQLFGRLRGPIAEDLMTRELTRTLR